MIKADSKFYELETRSGPESLVPFRSEVAQSKAGG